MVQNIVLKNWMTFETVAWWRLSGEFNPYSTSLPPFFFSFRCFFFILVYLLFLFLFLSSISLLLFGYIYWKERRQYRCVQVVLDSWVCLLWLQIVMVITLALSDAIIKWLCRSLSEAQVVLWGLDLPRSSPPHALLPTPQGSHRCWACFSPTGFLQAFSHSHRREQP